MAQSTIWRRCAGAELAIASILSVLQICAFALLGDVAHSSQRQFVMLPFRPMTIEANNLAAIWTPEL